MQSKKYFDSTKTKNSHGVIWKRKQILICPNNMGIHVKPLDILYVPTHFAIYVAFCNNSPIWK